MSRESDWYGFELKLQRVLECNKHLDWRWKKMEETE